MILGSYNKQHCGAIKVTSGLFVLGDQVDINGVTYTVISTDGMISPGVYGLWLDRPLEADVRDLDSIKYVGKWPASKYFVFGGKS